MNSIFSRANASKNEIRTEQLNKKKEDTPPYLTREISKPVALL